MKIKVDWKPDILKMVTSTFSGFNEAPPAPVDALDSAIYPSLSGWVMSGSPRGAARQRPKKQSKKEHLELVKTFGAKYRESLKTAPSIRSIAPEYADNCTKMMARAGQGKAGLVELDELLSVSRCNANFVNEQGFCALHAAAKDGHLWTAKKLIKHNAKVNMSCTHPDYQGWTPLHFAVCSGNMPEGEGDGTVHPDQDAERLATASPADIRLSETLELIDLLLVHGADATAVTANGETPFDLAVLEQRPKSIIDTLDAGNLLKLELLKIGLWARLEMIVRSNGIYSLADLDDKTFFELKELRGTNGARVGAYDAFLIWSSRYPVAVAWVSLIFKLALALLVVWLFACLAESVTGTAIFDN
mmetsp:Transcript_21435/g.55905  ORF Transcript_21435/g.55905 Transcript_21435/m.55905 type:complete len:360 (+) Transcript_21435:283-1362(+)